MYSISHLVYFCKVVETHSMNSAAEELYISQSALCRAMKSLEGELGVELFKRSNRGVRTTDSGERLYRYASRILHQMDLIDSLTSSGPDPVLSFSTYPFLFIGPVVEKYLTSRERSESQLEVFECPAEQVITNVYTGSSEFGIIQYNQAQSREFFALLKKHQLTFIPMATAVWAACVGPASPFYRRECVTIEELSSIPMLRQGEDCLSTISGGIKGGDMTIEEMQHSHVDSSFLAMHLLRKADCWRMSCALDAASAQEYGLRLIPISGVDITVTAGLLKQENHTLSAAAQDFSDYLGKSLSAMQ